MEFQFDEDGADETRPVVQDRVTGDTIRVTKGKPDAVQNDRDGIAGTVSADARVAETGSQVVGNDRAAGSGAEGDARTVNQRPLGGTGSKPAKRQVQRDLFAGDGNRNRTNAGSAG